MPWGDLSEVVIAVVDSRTKDPITEFLLCLHNQHPQSHPHHGWPSMIPCWCGSIAVRSKGVDVFAHRTSKR